MKQKGREGQLKSLIAIQGEPLTKKIDSMKKELERSTVSSAKRPASGSKLL